MFNSILTLVLRNFFRNLSYSLITMSSLVVGITTAILLLVWVQYEFSYNRSLPDSDRIYALLINDVVEGEVVTEEGVNVPLLDYFVNAIPEIEAVTRIDNSSALFTNGEKSVQKVGVYGDSSFFDVHQVQFLSGDPKKTLSGNQSIAISQELAGLLFNNQDVLGKTILIDHKTEFKVSAVYSNFPRNSSFNYIQFVLPFHAKLRQDDEWLNYDIKLFDAASRESVEQKINQKFKEYNENDKTTAMLFCLTDWRLHWNFENGKASGGRIVYVIIFSFTGLFVLVMACINYMNIATARATKRMREIGVRKMTGATQITLIRQFMTESLVLTFLASGLSLLTAKILLPFFNQLIGVKLSISIINPILLTGLFSISLFAGFLAGLYPALLLSSFKPAAVLKGNLSLGLTGSGLRKGLVIFQFSVSIIMVFCALVMWQQTDYMLKKALGYDKHRIINVWLEEDRTYSLSSLKSSLLSHTAIESAAFGGASPMEVNGYSECNRVFSPSPDPFMFYGANIDEDILPTLKFNIVQGRNFSDERASDSSNFIITQKAADMLGLGNPIGERISYNMFGAQQGEIIGVIGDFQNDDIHIPEKPVVFVLGKQKYIRNLFVRYREDKLEEALDHIKAVFEKLQTGLPISYSFLDSDFEDQLYREKFLGKISIVFTVIAVTVGCLGLFGLVLFNTQRRTKEIGVRKVLGATVNQMTIMLCRDFLPPLLYAFLLAFPIAYFLMQKFLNGYPSRINIPLVTFIIVVTVMMILVLLTISYQSIKAARQNPADSLKSE